MRWTAVMLAGFIATIGPAEAQEIRTALMRDLLSTLPTGILQPEAGPSLIFYDRAALLRATDRPGADDGEASALAPWQRLESLPNHLAASMVGGVDGAWRARVGFDLSDVTGMLAYWVPPAQVTVLAVEGGTGADTIVSALLANGYTAESHDGWQALWRGEDDFGIDFTLRDPHDPFVGQLGRSSRVAVNMPFVAYSPGWAFIEAVMAEPAANLAVLPQLVSLLDALDEDRFGDASIVQAVVLTPPDPRIFVNRTDVVPPWQLALFADLSTGAVDHGVLALAFTDRASAESAAARVLAGIAAPGRSGPSILEASEGEGRAWVSEAGTLPVLLLDIRREMRGAAETPNNPAYRALIRAVMDADLPFLRL